ncbi:MAG: acyl carrier protein [Actinobacteria bacterium]|jgi:acyl carrier protein|nr:acyl carrier protein [Actinomycetota bacterium]MCO5299810.1 acyl carrier protein [Candidatus Nanopelagicales bacterium]HPQ85474.1 acyl carrier protein [Actinomycetota bacterium]
MNDTQARELVLNALADVAPEIDTATFDPDTSLRDGAELDSMDFLAYVSGVSEVLDIDVPEDDYSRLDTVNSAVAYVVEKAGA